MLFLFALIALFTSIISAAPTATSTAPSTTTTACQAKTFNKPWTLSLITIYTPADQNSTNPHSAISFHFCDDNDGLQMETDCSGAVLDGKVEADNGGYVLCINETVAFKYSTDLMMMERAFIDDCLGPYPYNGGIAFGQNNTQMTTTTSASGIMSSQEQMIVEITEMS